MWMQHSLKVTSAFMFSSCCTIKYRAILDRKKVYVDIFLSNFIPVAASEEFSLCNRRFPRISKLKLIAFYSLKRQTNCDF